jgi:hypothetical protein
MSHSLAVSPRAVNFRQGADAPDWAIDRIGVRAFMGAFFGITKFAQATRFSYHIRHTGQPS